MTGSLDGRGGRGGRDEGGGEAGRGRVDRQLEDARAEVRVLTEQLAIAERVHQKLRGRIASLERALGERGAPLPPQPVEAVEPAFGRDEAHIRASSRPKPSGDAEDYGFGEHEDDLLPEPDPDEPHPRWRRHS